MSTVPNHKNEVRGLFKFLLYIPVPWVFVLTYLAEVGLQLLFPVKFHSPELPFYVRISGGLLFTAGAAIAGWSLIIFRKNRNTTVPGQESKNWSPGDLTGFPVIRCMLV